MYEQSGQMGKKTYKPISRDRGRHIWSETGSVTVGGIAGVIMVISSTDVGDKALEPSSCGGFSELSSDVNHDYSQIRHCFA